MSESTGSDDSRYIPQREKQRLRAFYNGKICAVTKSAVAVHWSQAPAQSRTSYQLNDMINLKIVPLDFALASAANSWPLIATVQAAFDQGSFVVFPLQDQIQHFIQIEENQLLRREAIIAAGGQDPGRPTYATSYGALAPVNSFDILFHPCFPDSSIHQTSTFTVYRTFPGVDNLHLPTMPALDLLLHPNMVIYAYAESRRPPLDQSDLMVDDLARYLMRLWRVLPTSFRTLPRPAYASTPLPAPPPGARLDTIVRFSNPVTISTSLSSPVIQQNANKVGDSGYGGGTSIESIEGWREQVSVLAQDDQPYSVGLNEGDVAKGLG